jgi:predicted deacetylase
VPASPIEAALCVSIHDVAPATWALCQRLHATVRAVADVPLTWLVVPHYHGCRAFPRAYEGALDTLLAQGHELALHGYTHRDRLGRVGVARAWRSPLRQLYARDEGEFSALELAQACRRIALGRAWFARRGYPLHGFVAPAWLLSASAWQALQQFPFAYTTTLWRFWRLHPRRALASPCLVYGARNAATRCLSRGWSECLARALAPAPLLRLALHPRDACHPALMRHVQQVLAVALAQRRACTKASFARALALHQAPPCHQGG